MVPAGPPWPYPRRVPSKREVADEVTAAPERAARDTARRGGDADWLKPAVRLGMVVYGVVHLVVAVLALQLALGDRSGTTNSDGALATLARQPFGQVVIWVVAVGMALLVAWRLLDAVAGHAGEEGSELWKHRASDIFKAVVYGVLAVSAVQAALGGGSGGGSTSESASSRLMGLPGGQLLVGLVGVGILAYAAGEVWQGLSHKHAEHLEIGGRTGASGRAYLALGTAGYVSKGIALGIVGVLFCYAAITHDPKQSGGLDQALREVLSQPFGPWLLGAIAVGIGCYGLFCFARARHLDR